MTSLPVADCSTFLLLRWENSVADGTQFVLRSVNRSGLLQHDARWSTVMNIHAQAGLMYPVH